MTNSHPNADPALVIRMSVGNPGGPRVAVKDCIDIRDHVTRCGSAAFDKAAPAAGNAEVVNRLLEAGGRIVGKANMHELAYGMTGVNARFGTPVNARWPDRIPGGSSSGSAAAVAAGLVDFAIGTDTGGSIRQPAICCGVIGLKPTFGRVSRQGAMPAESSLDCIGPFARGMAMIETAMAAITPDFRPAVLNRSPRLLRIAVEGAAPEIVAAFDALGLGADRPAVTLVGIDAAFEAGMTVIGWETARAFGQLLREGRPLGPDIAARLRRAMQITPEELAHANAIRAAFTAEVDHALADCDALVMPALPVVPPTLAESADPATVLPLTRYLRPFNLTGHPAIVLPLRTADDLPAGLQLVARKGADELLCAVARHCDPTPETQTRD